MFSVISVMSYPMIGVDVLMYSTEGKSETSYPMTTVTYTHLEHLIPRPAKNII